MRRFPSHARGVYAVASISLKIIFGRALHIKTRFIFMGVLLVSALSHASVFIVSEKEPVTNKLFQRCTGFVAGNAGQRVFYTARHCAFDILHVIEDLAQVERVNLMFNSVGVAENPLEVSTELKVFPKTTRRELTLFQPDFSDVGFSKLNPEDFATLHSQPLAGKLPRLNDLLSVTGFPEGKPLAINSCRYLGAVLFMPIEYGDVFAVKHKMYCENVPTDQVWGGMSGAPVTNAAGEVVGVFTVGSNSNRGILFFDDLVTDYSANKSIVFKQATTIFSNEHFSLKVTLDKESRIEKAGTFKFKDTLQFDPKNYSQNELNRLNRLIGRSQFSEK